MFRCIPVLSTAARHGVVVMRPAMKTMSMKNVAFSQVARFSQLRSFSTEEAEKKAAQTETTEEPEEPEKAGDKGSTEEGPLKAFSWSTIAAFIALGTGLTLFYQYLKDNRRTDVKEYESQGKPLVGGPFDLVDDDGKRVTSEDFKGKYMLLYFGFTYCPDICPAELVKMMAVLETLKKTPGLPNVTPVFITIDPERDTPKRIKEYKKNYTSDMVWLSGPIEKIDEAAKAYRCYYSIPTKEERQGDNDYLVDHSIFFYLVNPEGDFMEFFGKNLTASEVSSKMVRAIQRHQTRQKVV